MRALIVGYGRMGKLVESLCPEFGIDVAGTVDVDEADAPERWPAADVAIDFSIADAVPENLRRLGGYAVVNLSLEWLVESRTTLFIRGDNLFDRNYELAADFATGGARVMAGVRWRL